MHILIIIIHFVFAKSPAVCDSLSGLACAPGTFEDGTGSVVKESELQKRRALEENKARKYFETEFKKALENPDNTYFREVSLQAFGLVDSPQCQEGLSSNSAVCNSNLLEGLVNLATVQSLGSGEIDRLGDTRAIYDLEENNIFSGIVESAHQKAQSGLGADPVAQKIKEKMLPEIKNLLTAKIDTFPMTSEQKKIMRSKINSIQFEGLGCDDFGQNINAMFIPNAYYNGPSNTFRYCSGMALESSSEFTLAMIIAHELAHSIDPCRIAEGFSKDAKFGETTNTDPVKLDEGSPYNALIRCLRDKKSIEAINLDMPSGGYGSSGGPPSGNNTGPSSQQSPNSAPPQEISLCNDQVTESFCDWMGAEILSDYIKKNHKLSRDQFINGYANAYRPICKTRVISQNERRAGRMSPDFPDVHPQSAQRIDRILLMNPDIRRDMGCPSRHSENIYCDFRSPEHTKEASPDFENLGRTAQ
jgi:hypothetical protein